MIERLRRFFRHEKDAFELVVESLWGVPQDRQECPEYRKGLTILGHIVLARQLWLSRLGGGPAPSESIFPEEMSLAQIQDRWKTVAGNWTRYLDGLDNPTLGTPREYQSLDGRSFRNLLEDILLHLVGHGFYHRGQIASLVKASGGQPALTDFIFWCREAIPRAE